ncbi:acetate--CoA ligase family protein [Pseudooctadecabacter jejudonensis]|uniref:CoA-binding domain-containing protein n=1 Tax=Pseudooctadecabacter jejudonensis TaxID=1391910 RepID=A0A1Y5SC22_9RHOB|nr:acetate--CoA ligase family protein [Pseudooctadecabacter jejudonensis]SLN34542.1 hypothetical protein PSJ8397_01710 [Pseudooctadecabacter jejudonensis]
MRTDLSRLFRPKSIAVIGGGAWCKSVTEQLIKSEFAGDIWPVHPRAEDICGLPAYPTAIDLPGVPDATFVGINKEATIGAVERLGRMGAGGAVCFASGFGETNDGHDANARLLKAAQNMPILGPNCYGMINALDGASLWPDQHGCRPVDTGVAILTQSSNIAINLTMQKRGLPIGYVITCGNQAQLTMANAAHALLDDPRVTAIGFHIEGFKDLPGWQSLARAAAAKNIPLVALKVGASAEAQAATVSHTASLAGSDAGAAAVLDHLGIARVHDLPTFIETLKLLHCTGPLTSTKIASVSCSGGEASLIADMADPTPLTFPPLNDRQKTDLATALGPKVALANPLDYHTYIWRDTDAMTQAFSAIIDPEIALTFLIVDFPRADICDPSDWECVIKAAIRTKAETGGTIAMVSTLPELMPEDVAATLMTGGIIPMNGVSEALGAVTAAQHRLPSPLDIIDPTPNTDAPVLTEAAAKAALNTHGMPVPQTWDGDLDTILAQTRTIAGPFVLKTTGLSHKSDAGGVVLNLRTEDDIRTAASKMGSQTLLLETMITDPIAELLVGVIKDPAHGFVLTLGAGGIYTELLQDTASCLVPATRDRIKQCLTQLKTYPRLIGYRNSPAANIESLIDTIDAVQNFVITHQNTIEEVEINPLIVTPSSAIAADALIRKRHD